MDNTECHATDPLQVAEGSDTLKHFTSHIQPCSLEDLVGSMLKSDISFEGVQTDPDQNLGQTRSNPALYTYIALPSYLAATLDWLVPGMTGNELE